ncbi:NuoM family protein [Leadbetterella sp. DM7]|uniref:complex I subunit 4 family protein n=1 Tax=Leadbetterella sp. DM7 TaxID=3235085 RepID=UPI00349EC2DF
MLTFILFLLPLISGVFLLWNKSTGLAKTVTVLVSLVQLALFIYMVSVFRQDAAALDYSWNWISDFRVGFHLGVDGLSLLMTGLAVVISGLILLATKDLNYDNISRFLGLILVTEAALIGVFTAKDAFLFYFFFEMALVPVYLMANLWGGRGISRITLKMFIYTVLGSLLMLVAFVVLYLFAQTSDLAELAKVPAGLRPGLNHLLFWGLLIAFAIKSPLFPFHGWLPDAYSKSPTPATMLLSGLLSKMGIYGILRILVPLSPAGITDFSGLVIYFAVVGLIYGSVIAIQQFHIKRLIAYSSFAHIGLMAAAALTLSPSGIQGSVFQMVAHGFSAVGLFYVAKIIHDKTGSRSLVDLGGMALRAPRLAVLFLIVLLGSVGLPLTNGFVGEFLMLRAVFDYQHILGIIAISSIILAAVYLLRLYQKTMFGPATPFTENIRDIGLNELVVLVPIAIVIIITGVFPNCLLDLSSYLADTLPLIK